MEGFTLALDLLGALGVFLYGLKVMSEGLQKAAGSKLREILSKATGNRFSATLSGFLVTCVVQSSSATTVMVVGFCSAGLLTLYQSLGIIFGANIGTTTTAWLVSLLGFKIKITKFALPLIGVGFFSQFIKRWKWPHKIGEALVGFGLLFLGLHLLKEAIPNVHDAPQVIAMMTAFEPSTLAGTAAAMAVGALVTTIFQSSSATMAVTLTLAAKGFLDFPTAAALVIGQNIGTTVTAVLAAIGSPLTARRSALAHFLFNVLGSVWVLLLFHPLLRVVDLLVPGDPYGTGPAALLVAIPIHLSAFHTFFNVVNTVIMLAVIKPFERLVIWLMPGKRKRGDNDLVYLSTPLTRTPELVIPAAQKEVDRMAGITLRMLGNIKKALRVSQAEQEPLLLQIRKDEKTTDVLENSITGFLASITHEHISTAANKEALSLLSMINDLERIGDHGEKLAILLDRQGDKAYRFTDFAVKDIQLMADKTGDILEAMRALILHRTKDPVPEALAREKALDALRDKLRHCHLDRMVKGKCKPLAGVLFTDMLTSFEKMGDHAFNVVEACAGVK